MEIVTVDGSDSMDSADTVDGADEAAVGSAVDVEADRVPFGGNLIFIPSKVDVVGSRDARSMRSGHSGLSGHSGYSNDDEGGDDDDDGCDDGADCGAERDDVAASVLLFASPRMPSFGLSPHSVHSAKLRKSESEFLRGLPDEDEHSEEATPVAAVRRSLSLPELELRRDSGAVDHGKLQQNRWGSSIPLHEGGLMEGVEALSEHRFFYKVKGVQIKRWHRERKRESFRERIEEDTAASRELEDEVINQMITDSEMECSAPETVGMDIDL